MIVVEAGEPGVLVFEPTCHLCGVVLDRIPVEDPGNWKEAFAWSMIAFARHIERGECSGRAA